MKVFEYVIVRYSEEENPTEEKPPLLDGGVHVCLAEHPTQVMRQVERLLEKSNQLPLNGEEIRILVRPFKLLGFDESYCGFLKKSDRGFIDERGKPWSML